MTKSELENGMIVRNDIGTFGLYLKGVGIIWKQTNMGNDTEMDLEKSYNEDLRYIDNVNFYIDKVYKYNNPLELQAFFDKRFNEIDLTLVWERNDGAKDEQRYIRITSSDKDTYWYANKIGKVYKVMGEFRDANFNMRVTIQVSTNKYVIYGDFEYITESEYKQAKELKVGDKVKVKKGYYNEGKVGTITKVDLNGDIHYEVDFNDITLAYGREELKKVK